MRILSSKETKIKHYKIRIRIIKKIIIEKKIRLWEISFMKYRQIKRNMYKVKRNWNYTRYNWWIFATWQCFSLGNNIEPQMMHALKDQGCVKENEHNVRKMNPSFILWWNFILQKINLEAVQCAKSYKSCIIE